MDIHVSTTDLLMIVNQMKIKVNLVAGVLSRLSPQLTLGPHTKINICTAEACSLALSRNSSFILYKFLVYELVFIRMRSINKDQLHHWVSATVYRFYQAHKLLV